MPQESIKRQDSRSAPEDLFTLLFSQVFGLEKASLLAPEYPVTDIYGGSRFVDYALQTSDGKIAFEIDGLTWHHPAAVTVADYEDQLLRQNSLIHLGWRVFRCTDRQITQEPEQVEEQLTLFLERIPGLLALDDFLPKQHGALLELRPHQEEALRALDNLRKEGKTIALLWHATGVGKTVTAVTDARRLAGRTLYVVHKRDLVTQTFDKFRELWPEASTGLYFGGAHDPEAFNVIGSVQSVAEDLDCFGPEQFAYLIIDEAHHATAPTYRRILGYFRPRFILGLTATPDRADGETALELFRECAHRLSLREAVETGELVPIRCVRVETNVDLSKVRYNQVQYNRRDLEETVTVPARDELIVNTYRDHVQGRKAVAFCVNVRHGEDLAQAFRKAGVAARSVSGRTPGKEREKILQAFHEGELRVLCACDLLNEGWDCPDVEVLLMARPTLSKVIYLQQLGRGTRRAPGKECLIVFDFVDNASRYNQSLNLHRVLGNPRYRHGGLILATPEQLAAEEEALARGERPTAVLELALWAKEYREIDVFNWQEAVRGMLSIPELEVSLYAGEGRVRRAVERGELLPDHSITLGDRTLHYFKAERKEEVRKALSLPEITDDNIRSFFIQFVEEMDMGASYKPVMLLALLDSVDEKGRAKVSDLARRFGDFYEKRRQAGLTVERANTVMARVESLGEADIQRVVLRMPLEKFGRRGYIDHDRRDASHIRFSPRLWRLLSPEDLSRIRELCHQAIRAYYERIDVQ
jgi:superfamily II DNA or RNA helicase